MARAGRMRARREITRADVLSMEEYGRMREASRRQVREARRRRRVEVGPFAAFSFECYETMWHQVHEMLYVEKGGEEQIAGELAAYNPLIPKGSELVATLMFEIDEPGRRARELARLGGVEGTVTMGFAGETVRSVPEEDVERTRPDGRTSSVHFLRFPFTAEQIRKFRAPGARVVLGIGHAFYAHMAVLPEEVRETLAADFD